MTKVETVTTKLVEIKYPKTKQTILRLKKFGRQKKFYAFLNGVYKNFKKKKELFPLSREAK